MLAGNPRNQKQTVLGEFYHQRLPQQIQLRPKQKDLVQQLQRRNRQVAILNAVNSRLGQQLLVLQQKLGVTPEHLLQQLQNLGQPSLAFHFETGQLQYLDALLTSYDDSSLSQKKMIGKLFNQLTEMQRRAQSLVKDNAFLMDELQGKCRTVLQIYANGFPEENLAGIYSKLQQDDLEAKYATVREENQYLKGSWRDIEARLQGVQQEAENSGKQAKTHFENYKKQTEQLQEALMRVEDLTRINEILKRKFDEVTDQNNGLEAKRYDLETRVARIDNELKLARTQLMNARRAEKEAALKLQEQVASLTQELEMTQKRERECFNKSLTNQKELEVTKEALRKSKREHEQTKKDFEQTLKMLETYELKISNYVKKEESVERIAKENREKIESALLERDRAVLKQQQLSKQIENQGAKHRQQLKSLTESYEKIIRSLNQKCSSLQQSLQQQQSTHQQTQTSFKSQTQKLRRQITQLRDQNSKFLTTLKTGQSQQLASKLKDYQQRNQSLKRIMQQQQRTYKDQTQDRLQTIRKLQSQNRQMSRQLEKERTAVRDKESDKSTIKSKLNMLTKERDSLLEEVDRVKKTYEIKAATFQSDQSSRVAELEQKLAEAVRREKNAREKAIAMLEGYDEAEDKLKFQYQSRIKELELQNQTLKAKLLVKISKNK